MANILNEEEMLQLKAKIKELYEAEQKKIDQAVHADIEAWADQTKQSKPDKKG